MAEPTLNKRQLKESFPDEPWHWRLDWHQGVIKGSAMKEAVVLGVCAVLFIVISLPGVLAIPAELKKENWAILVVLLFPLVGLGVGWRVGRKLRQVFRYGTLVYRPAALPGSWGGWVEGIVTIPQGALVTGAVEISGATRERTAHRYAGW